MAVKRDVTQELKVEAQLRQMQKMESIGTLASGIAHDLNNALAFFSGMRLDDRTRQTVKA